MRLAKTVPRVANLPRSFECRTCGIVITTEDTLEPEGQGFRISHSALTLRAQVPNLADATFARMVLRDSNTSGTRGKRGVQSLKNGPQPLLGLLDSPAQALRR
jgi:hypothetical protein